jgi:hypothetical protein
MRALLHAHGHQWYFITAVAAVTKQQLEKKAHETDDVGTQLPIPESEPSFRCSPSSSTVIPGSVRSPLLAAQMGTTTIDNDEQQYACKCLNIRLRPAATQTVPAELNADPDFIPLFIGDEGIVVVCFNHALSIVY